MRTHFANGFRGKRPAFSRRSSYGRAATRPSVEGGFAQLRKLIRCAHPFALVAMILLTVSASAAGTSELKGQFGGDLGWLSHFYTAPATCGESNHYIDLWDGDKLPGLIRTGGLRNNNALFVNSHGQGYLYGRSRHYAFYPHRRLLNRPEPTPHYSARDLATVLGANADKIHNIVLAGCDIENAFDARELRKYFVNATNITHTVAGKPGYQPMYLQAIFSPSQNVEPLYEVATTTPGGKKEYRITGVAKASATRLLPYVAELYRPGSNKPYRTQTAGRELLDPRSGSITVAAAP